MERKAMKHDVANYCSTSCKLSFFFSFLNNLSGNYIDTVFINDMSRLFYFNFQYN